MNTKTVINAVVAVVLIFCANILHAKAELKIQEVGFVGSGLEVVSGEFQLEQSGRYEIQLIDQSSVDTANQFLVPFTELKLLLLKDGQTYIESMASPGKSLPLNLEAGIYQVYIAGKTDQIDRKISQYYVQIAAEADDSQIAYSTIGFLPENSTTSKVEGAYLNLVGIAETADYKIYLTNFAFPKMLKSLQLLVTNDADGSDSLQLNASSKMQDVSSIFSANAGDALTIATYAVPDDEIEKGLFGIKLVKMVGSHEITVFETATPVGADDGEPENTTILTQKHIFTISSPGEQILKFADLQDSFYEMQGIDPTSKPSYVESLTFTISSLSSREIILNQAATEDDIELNLAAGDYALNIMSPVAGDQEVVYGVRLIDAVTQTQIFDHTEVIGPNFLLSEKLPSLSSQSKLILADLCERARFTKLGLMLSNGIDIIEYLPIEYSVNDPSYCSSPVIEEIIIATSSALSYQVHVYAVAPEATNEGVNRPALYNIQVLDQNTNQLIFENTGSLQGDYFNLGYEFDIPTEGSGTISLTDYVFPDSFSELKLVITNGTQKVTIYGATQSGSSYTYDSLLPGKYFATILANLQDDSNLATYGVQMTYEPKISNQGGTTPPPVDNQNGGGGGGSTSMLLGLLLIAGLRFHRK